MILRAYTVDQNVRKKLNEIRQKQLESYTNRQAIKSSTSASDKSLIIAVLGGVAAGFTTGWLMNAFLSTEYGNLITQKSRVAFYEYEIRGLNKTIEQLNERVELLTESITALETELTQATGLVELNNKTEKTTITAQGKFETEEEKTASTLTDPL